MTPAAPRPARTTHTPAPAARSVAGPHQPSLIEVQGPTIAQAIQKALAQLHVARHQVRVQILSEGQPGLFGMRGKKQATVRVILIKPSNKS